MLDTGQYETLVTSLPRSFTLQEIKELYHARWGIETAFRELKYGFGLVNLHGKNDDFVNQEIKLIGTWRFIYARNFIGKKTGTENS